jgi:gliding motility-associated-like protein
LGASAIWYDDPGFGIPIGSGNDLEIPSPDVSTTYYVRFEGDCDTTGSVNTSVFVLQLAAPEILEADTSVCVSGPLYRYVVRGLPGSTFDWTISGGNIDTNNGDTIFVNWGNLAGSYILAVTENSAGGCVSDLLQIDVEAGGPNVDLGFDLQLCEGTAESITPTGTFTFHMWHDGSTDPNYIADTTELVRIQVFDAEGCTAFDSVQVTSYPMPVVDLGNDTTHCGPLRLTLDAGNPGATYQWSSGEMTQQIDVSGNVGSVWVLVTFGMNCTAGDTLNVIQCSVKDYFANIPNLFTPNADGKNDTWFFYESASFPEMVIEIYDRWGRLVFLSEAGYPDPWDGRSMNGRELPMDSYHYIIKLNDGFEEIVGTVTVVR